MLRTMSTEIGTVDPVKRKIQYTTASLRKLISRQTMAVIAAS